MLSVHVKHHYRKKALVPEHRSCVKIQVAVPNSPRGLCGRKATEEVFGFRAQELWCESRGGRHGLPVPNSPYGLCGRKTTFKEEDEVLARCP